MFTQSNTVQYCFAAPLRLGSNTYHEFLCSLVFAQLFLMLTIFNNASLRCLRAERSPALRATGQPRVEHHSNNVIKISGQSFHQSWPWPSFIRSRLCVPTAASMCRAVACLSHILSHILLRTDAMFPESIPESEIVDFGCFSHTRCRCHSVPRCATRMLSF